MAAFAKFDFSNSSVANSGFAVIEGPTAIGDKASSNGITFELLQVFSGASASSTLIDPAGSPYYTDFNEQCLERYWTLTSGATGIGRYKGLTPGASYLFRYMSPNSSATRPLGVSDGTTSIQVTSAGGTNQTPQAPTEITSVADVNGYIDHTFSIVDTAALLMAVTVDPVASGPSITDVDTDNDVYPGQTGVVITGTAFGATQGSGTVTITSPSTSTTITQAVTSWSDTAVEITVVNIDGSNALPYAASQTLTLTDDAAASDTHTITLSPPAGTTVVDVVSPDTTSASLFQDATPAVAGGDQVWWELVSGENVVVNANGTMTSDSDTAVITFRLWDATDETISAEYTATLADGVVSVGRGRKQFRISFGMGF